MMDVFTRAKRSEVMSRIRARDTKPELAVRSILHKMGYRFRINRKDLPGKPDIILPRHQTVIFVHGCFWHRHKRCKFAYTPKSRMKFWADKFDSNVKRDLKVRRQLIKLDWHVLTVWECELRSEEKLTARLKTELRD
jgi:DNA mismatch endonuclease (patch repair protein)